MGIGIGKKHHELLELAEKRLREGYDLNDGEFFLCAVCGNLEYAQVLPDEMCTVCGHDPMFFSKVDIIP